jgi:peptidoglycan-N-acetylglucosamine deacetylase
VLDKHGVTATFFVIADRVRSISELDAIVSKGHSLGNHLKTTRPCSELSLEEFQRDFDACQALLESVAVAAPTLFRPASGFASEDQIAYVQSRGSIPVLGTVYPMDHWISNPGRLTLLVRWLSVPGGIVILHDGRTRGRTTAAVLDRLIPQLKSAGYRIESLAAAFASKSSSEAPITKIEKRPLSPSTVTELTLGYSRNRSR